MKASQVRRERLFQDGKPVIRPIVYDDIRWLWAAARREGFDGQAEQFTRWVEPMLAEADKVFMLEDTNHEFQHGSGPVGIVLANYDGWSLIPHVKWFPWATPRNMLRCSVGFLQAMKYAHDVGCIKIYASAVDAAWFRRLKRYIAISLVGRIPGGTSAGEECIFYLRGRKQSGRHHQNAAWRTQQAKDQHNSNHVPATTGSTA